MASIGKINNNEKIKKLITKYEAKRKVLKEVVKDESVAFPEKIRAMMQLHQLPRNSSKVRYRNRCKVTGRPRGYLRKFEMSRISFREMASFALLAGVKKSSW